LVKSCGLTSSPLPRVGDAVIIESQSPPANLLSEYSIFFNQVIDDTVLMLVHPSSHASDEK
jgi:hypothetical protein